MQSKHNPKVNAAKWVGLPHATGDGINMATKIDAKLVNMSHLIAFPGTIFDFNGSPTEMSTRLQFPPKHITKSVWINRKGYRFVNEHGSPDTREVAFLNQEELLFYVIFNHHILKQSTSLDIRNWDKKKMDKEISRGNIIASAESIEDLARKINIPASQMLKTIDQYNKDIENNVIDSFGREKQDRFMLLVLVGAF
jgi:succinate dehydrogenase/fumarate reductase flavoprotein subunit